MELLRHDRIVWLIGTALVAGTIFFSVKDYDFRIAWDGFSPKIWVEQEANPEAFRGDFPNGVGGYQKSAFMAIYKGAFSFFGVDPGGMVPWVIGLEVLGVALILVLLMRELTPETDPVVVLLLLALVITSSARNINIARFGQPFFMGLYYNAADIFRVLAVILFLRERFLACALSLTLVYFIHPTMGMMGGLLLAGMALPVLRRLVRWEVGAGALLFVVLGGLWTWFKFQGASLDGGAIPTEEWYRWTVVNSMHWYPLDFGTFTGRNQYEFVPFVSFLAVLLLVLGDRKRTLQDNQVVVGLAVMLAVTVAGVLISVAKPSPALIKLALHRANDMIVLVGLVYLVQGLWEHAKENLWLERVASVGLLLSPFAPGTLFPIGFSAVLVLSVWRRKGKSFVDDPLRVASLVVLGLGVVYLIWLNLAGYSSSSAVHSYFGWGMFKTPLVLGTWLVMLAVLGFTRLRPALPYVVMGAMVVLATVWQLDQEMPPSRKANWGAYRDAQIWARGNTPTGALFMVDPTNSYGWRDFSGRPSFGVFREWTHTGWLYDSQQRIYNEGMRRFGEYGILPNSDPRLTSLQRYYATIAELRKRYYSADTEWFQKLAEKYGIDFVVFNRWEGGKKLNFPVAYQNNYFLIYQTKH